MPILVALAGMFNDPDNCEQYLNAPWPIVSTLSGMVKEVKLEQLKNA
jgi:hypothetical protein